MGSSPSVERDDNMHVVIVGGGYGGAYLAHKLVKANLCKITLIDPRDGMFHSIGALRTSVDESYGKKLFVPYDKIVGESFVRGKVVNLDTKAKTVALEDGKTVTYTHLIIATGTSSPFPGKFGTDNPSISSEEALKMYSDYRKEIVAAKRVVLIGGGAVGVELAGEIKVDFPDKEATIVNSRDYLISSRLKPAFYKKLTHALQALKITVMLNERVANIDDLTLNKNVADQVVKTESGKEIVCDLVVPCTGTKINNQFFKEELADALNEAGAIRVDDCFHVQGHDDVFAIGDITDVGEEKMAYTAKLHADVVVANFKGKQIKYKPGDEAMVVPLGRTGGVGQFKGMILGDFMSKMFKSKDLFGSSIWGDLGVKYPN